ncbi:MAG: hypothetical protein DMD83_27670, partial [Candidatus Rokuibacteriota bacterium]
FPLDRDTVHGRAVTDRRTIHVPDVAVAVRTAFPAQRDRGRATGVGTLLATPLLRDGLAIGVIVIRRTTVRPFTMTQITLLKTFADQAAIAIDHARLSMELGVRDSQIEAKNRELTEALAQQTATSEILREALGRQTATAEILRVIGTSPTDAQPVFEGIARSGVRVCGALGCVVFVVEGDMLRVAA